MSNPVRWFEIYVQDMDRAKSFYESVFNLKLSALESPGMQMWAFSMDETAPGVAGALVKMDGVASGGGGTLVYFGCEDCATEAALATENGGHIEKPKSSIGPYGHIALVVDTEGNMIGLHSMK